MVETNNKTLNCQKFLTVFEDFNPTILWGGGQLPPTSLRVNPFFKPMKYYKISLDQRFLKPKKKFSSKNFFPPKYFCQTHLYIKFFTWSKPHTKTSQAEHFRPQSCYILGQQRNFWIEKNFVSKKFWVKIFWVKNFFGSKKCWVKKKFGQKIWTRNFICLKKTGRVNPRGRIYDPPQKIVGLKLCWIVVSLAWKGRLQNFRPLGSFFLV